MRRGNENTFSDLRDSDFDGLWLGGFYLVVCDDKGNMEVGTKMIKPKYGQLSTRNNPAFIASGDFYIHTPEEFEGELREVFIFGFQQALLSSATGADDPQKLFELYKKEHEKEKAK